MSHCLFFVHLVTGLFCYSDAGSSSSKNIKVVKKLKNAKQRISNSFSKSATLKDFYIEKYFGAKKSSKNAGMITSFCTILIYYYYYRKVYFRLCCLPLVFSSLEILIFYLVCVVLYSRYFSDSDGRAIFFWKL